MEPTIHHIERTTSTQLEARKLIEKGAAKLGDMVFANEQTAARGRFGRSWISPLGGMYVTIILPLDPAMSLKAGLAVVRVLQSAGIDAGLKWPNDVNVKGLKIAGVLTETFNNYSLVGIGLNLTSAPLETATCVAQHGVAPDRDEWAQEIASVLTEMSSEILDLDEYRSACLTLGHRVRIEGIGEDSGIEGTAEDVDEAGRLIIQTKDGRRTITSGECFHLRPAATKR